jgi:hypothetical protein
MDNATVLEKVNGTKLPAENAWGWDTGDDYETVDGLIV